MHHKSLTRNRTNSLRQLLLIQMSKRQNRFGKDNRGKRNRRDITKRSLNPLNTDKVLKIWLYFLIFTHLLVFLLNSLYWNIYFLYMCCEITLNVLWYIKLLFFHERVVICYLNRIFWYIFLKLTLFRIISMNYCNLVR